MKGGTITLSKELVDDVTATLCKYEEGCKDSWFASQYLAAIAAYSLAADPARRVSSEQLVTELANLIHYVYQDLTQQQSQNDAIGSAPKGDPEAAFGIWEPKD